MKLSLPLSLVLISMLLAPIPGLARTDADVAEAVRSAIMNRHPDDTPEWWRGLGPGAPKVIMRIYETDTSTFHHMRLLEGLSAFTDDPAAVDFIKAQADRTTDQVVRNDAIRVIGLSQGAKEEEFLDKYLHHEDPHTRLAAAQALKLIGDSHAQGKVREFLGEEQTPWVVAKLKGEKPRTPEALVPSGSSEDRISADFAGTWRGAWVSPRSDSAKGMKTESVELRLAVQGATGLSGGLSVESSGKTRMVPLTGLSGKAGKWSGTVSDGPCEAELFQQGGNYLMQVRFPRTGSLMWLRRDPSG